MRSTLILALGLFIAYPANADTHSRRVTVHEECTRDRCVYYHGSQRVFSVEKEPNTSRLIIKNDKRNTVAKLKRNDDGTVEVTIPDRRW